MANPSPVIQIGFTVRDVQRSMDSYCDALGATVARGAQPFSPEDMPVCGAGGVAGS